MGITALIQRTVARRLFPSTIEYFESQVNHQRDRSTYFEESLTTLQLEIENMGYQRLSQSNWADYRYSRRHLISIIELSVHMALKNPITCRTVNVQADYVFGQGVSFQAKHPWVQEVIDEFVAYRENRKTLTSHTAMCRQEKRQQIYGSIFFVLYTNKKTGRVIVRTINTLEVADIICDPDDSEKEWFFKHTFSDSKGSLTTIYHPALGIDQDSGVPLPWVVNPQENADQGPIMWNAPIYHMAYNRIAKEKFAMPEVYPQLDWAIAYKRGLEDWSSIIRSFARMALKVTGLASKKQAAAAKGLIQTSIGLTNPLEKNPSPVGGSTGLFGKGVDVEAVKTAGATTPASDFEPVLDMATCGVGLPTSFFNGKTTAKADTLDRPTELHVRSRQLLWNEGFHDIIDYLIMESVKAPEGILAGYGASYQQVIDVFDGQVVNSPIWPKNKDPQFGPVGTPVDASYEIHFPELLERDVADRVRALVNAMTLFGKPLTDILPDKRLVAKLLLQALKIPNADSYIPMFVEMWEKNQKVQPGEWPPAESWIIPPAPPPSGGSGAEDPSQGGAVGKNG